MSQYIIVADGVSLRYKLPFDTSTITVFPVGSAIGGANELVWTTPLPEGTPISITYLPSVPAGLSTPGGASGGLSSEQLDALVSDPELAAALQPLAHATELTALVSTVVNAGKPSGETVLMTTPSGVAPAGWTKTSGPLSPTGLFAQNRLSLNNAPTTLNCLTGTRGYYVSGSGTSLAYNFGTASQVTIANFPASTYSTPGIALADDTYVWVFGGTDGGSGASSAAYRFTAQSGAWSTIASLPGVRRNLSGCRLNDGKLLLVGGTSGSLAVTNYTNTVWVYDALGTGSYAVKTPTTFRSYGGKTCVLADGRVFFVFPAVATSNDGTTTVNTPRAFIYNPLTDVWVELDPPGTSGLPIQLENGQVQVLSDSALSASVLHTLDTPAGSHWTAAPVTSPGTGTGQGCSVTSNSSFLTRVLDRYLPVRLNVGGGGSTLSALYYAGDATSGLAQPFYATKN